MTARLLLVSYHAPPAELPPARRAAAVAAALRVHGVEIDVLTTSYFGPPPDARTVTTADLRSLVARRRRPTGGPGPAPRLSRGRLSRLLVPDATAVTWLPTALPAARRLAAERGYAAAITSSPPESTHLVGVLLRRLGVPWLADLRDGWTFERPTAGSYWPQLDKRLEEAVLSRADVITVATQPIADELGRRLPVARVVHVPNLVDLEAPIEAPPEAPTADRFTIAYTGTGAADGKSPLPFLDALSMLIARRPELAGTLEVVFAGRFSREELAAMDAPHLRGVVRTLGRLPHAQALGLQRQADALLLLVSPGTVGVTTGKVFEYLAAKRPVFALAGGAGAELVAGAGPHTIVPHGPPAGIAAALEDFVDRWRSGVPFQPAVGFSIETYGPGATAEAYLSLLAEAGAL